METGKSESDGVVSHSPKAFSAKPMVNWACERGALLLDELQQAQNAWTADEKQQAIYELKEELEATLAYSQMAKELADRMMLERGRRDMAKTLERLAHARRRSTMRAEERATRVASLRRELRTLHRDLTDAAKSIDLLAMAGAA